MSAVETSSDGTRRGRSEGSIKSRFKKGEPSANPLGRGGKKKKKQSPETFDSVLAELMSEEVHVDLGDGRGKRKVSQTRAMAQSVINNFPKASVSQQLKILEMCRAISAQQAEIPDEEAREAAREAFVERFSAEYRADQIRKRDRGEDYHREVLERREAIDPTAPVQLDSMDSATN